MKRTYADGEEGVESTHANRDGRHNAHFSARWRRRSNIKADSKRQYPTSYSRFIMTFGLSLTVSELLAFVCGPEMTSCRFLR